MKLWTVNLLLTLLAFKADGSTGDLSNAVEFTHLCAAYKLAIGDPRLPWTESDKAGASPSERAANEMQRLNVLELATLPQDIYDLISGDGEYEKKCTTDGCRQQVTEEKWVIFQNIKKNKVASPGEISDFVGAAANVKNSNRQLLQKRIRKYAEEGSKLKDTITVKQGVIESKRREAILKLREAAFGASYAGSLKSKIESNTSTDPPADVPTTAFLDSNTNNEACGGHSSGNEAGRSIVSDAVCLCAPTSGVQSSKYCTKDAPFGSLSSEAYKKGSGAADAVKIWNALKGRCGSGQARVTVPAIATALANFRADLGKGAKTTESSHGSGDAKEWGGRFILGVYNVHASNTDGGKCDGTEPTTSAHNGVCVNYKDRYTEGKEIPWVEALEDAAHLIDTMFSEYEPVKALLNRLDVLVIAAEAEFHVLTSIPHPSLGTVINHTGNRGDTHSPLANEEKGQIVAGNRAFSQRNIITIGSTLLLFDN